MNKIYFNGIKAVVLSGLMGLVSFVHANVVYNEQIIVNNDFLATPIGGKSVSIDGEWAAVGAYDESNSNSCFITMFRLNYNVMQWIEHSTLGDNGGNCNANKGFGSSISLSGTEMVVGLANYATNGGSNNNGGAFSAYAFDGTDWVLIFDRVRPLKTDGTNDIQVLGGFGLSVNIQEGILVVGAPKYNGTAGVDTGKVYIYERPDPFNPPVSSLTPTATVEGDQAGSFFGSAVAGDREEILVGVPFYNQGVFTDNGAGFMYRYDPSATPRLKNIGAVYGSETDEHLGLQLEHISTFAAISGNQRSYGYRFDGSTWYSDLTLESTWGGDVDIIDNVGALSIKGSSVNLYPLLDRQINNYFLPITQKTGTPGAEFAEDISLYQNHMAVSDFTNKQALFYNMPCGYGGVLVENEWEMVSIPCKVSGQTVASIFGDDGLGAYDSNWVVYEQNASNYSGKSADYIRLDETSPIEQGKSYWILADANRTWKVDSSASTIHTDLNTTIIPNPDVVAGTYAISLPDADQNLSGAAYAKVMVGNPFARSFEWTNVQYYSVTDTNISLDTAETSNYMDSTAYIYDSSSTSGQPYTAVTTTPGVGSKTIPDNKGFWIKILAGAQFGDKLLIPLEK